MILKIILVLLYYTEEQKNYKCHNSLNFKFKQKRDILFLPMFIYLYLINLINSSDQFLEKNIKINDLSKYSNEKHLSIYNDTFNQPKNIFKSFGKFKDRRSWREYLNIDNFSFSDDVKEMFDKYNCKNFNVNIDNIKDLNDFYVFEDINSNIDIYDVDEIFTHLTYDFKSIYNNKYLNDIYHTYTLNKSYLIVSTKFNNFFTLIENDLIKTLNYFSQTVNKKFELFENSIIQLKKSKSIDEKIIVVLELISKILDGNICIKKQLNVNKKNYLNYVLMKNKSIFNPTRNFQVKYRCKLLQILNSVHNNEISISDIFNYTIYIFNITEDDYIKTLILYGLQNLFVNDMYKLAPRFFGVLIALYFLKYEKTQYMVNWPERIYKILTNSKIKPHRFLNSFITKKVIFENISDTQKLLLYLYTNSQYKYEDLFVSYEIDKYTLDSNLLVKFI